MSLININLLEQEQGALQRYNRAVIVVGVTAGSVIGLLLLIVVFLVSTNALRQNEKREVIKQTAEYQKQITELNKITNDLYPSLTLADQAKQYNKQVSSVKSLVENHKYFSLYLSEIAVNTPDAIVYESFTIEGTTQLGVAGVADTYEDVSKLAADFNNLSFAKSSSIAEAKAAQDPRTKRNIVKFALIIKLKSAGELNKLPRPGKFEAPKRSTASPSPKPSVSASPKASVSPGVLR